MWSSGWGLTESVTELSVEKKKKNPSHFVASNMNWYGGNDRKFDL